MSDLWLSPFVKESYKSSWPDSVVRYFHSVLESVKCPSISLNIFVLKAKNGKALSVSQLSPEVKNTASMLHHSTATPVLKCYRGYGLPASEYYVYDSAIQRELLPSGGLLHSGSVGTEILHNLARPRL